MTHTVRAYYALTKPGIVYGNIFSMLAGFFFVSGTHIDFRLLFFVTLGLWLVIASACVSNNILDRRIDEKMLRTKNRALVLGTISSKNALIFSALLGIIGSAILYFEVNAISFCVAFFGFIAYVVFYGYAKRTTHYSTVIGSISGAVPIVVGALAVTGQFNFTIFLLFVCMALWQMPHFYAIAIYRRDEYAQAGLPILSVKKDIKVVKKHILAFIIAYTIAVSSFAVFRVTGYVYLAIMLLVSFRWVLSALSGFRTLDDSQWAREIFRMSLLVLCAYCLTTAIGHLLP